MISRKEVHAKIDAEGNASLSNSNAGIGEDWSYFVGAWPQSLSVYHKTLIYNFETRKCALLGFHGKSSFGNSIKDLF